MEVILLERIGKLGQMGDVVRVKDGYARNFLIPQGKALRANKHNLSYFEQQRTQLEARNLELKTEAQSVAEKITGRSFVVIRQAGDSGQLYGSVNSRDIAELVTEGGCTVERRQILLDRPMKELGLHNVKIAVHPEVVVDVTINVARTEDEAERQARGEDILDDFEDETERDQTVDFSPEEIFEDEDVASQAVEALSEQDETDEVQKSDLEAASATQSGSGDEVADKKK